MTGSPERVLGGGVKKKIQHPGKAVWLPDTVDIPP